jgi:hypothetical protein
MLSFLNVNYLYVGFGCFCFFQSTLNLSFYIHYKIFMTEMLDMLNEYRLYLLDIYPLNSLSKEEIQNYRTWTSTLMDSGVYELFSYHKRLTYIYDKYKKSEMKYFKEEDLRNIVMIYNSIYKLFKMNCDESDVNLVYIYHMNRLIQINIKKYRDDKPLLYIDNLGIFNVVIYTMPLLCLISKFVISRD